LFFNKMELSHIESGVSQLSQISLCFYLFAGLDSVSALFGHQMDTKLDTKTASTSDEPSVAEFGVHIPSHRIDFSEFTLEQRGCRPLSTAIARTAIWLPNRASIVRC
jgi:hypothetical protein